MRYLIIGKVISDVFHYNCVRESCKVRSFLMVCRPKCIPHAVLDSLAFSQNDGHLLLVHKHSFYLISLADVTMQNCPLKLGIAIELYFISFHFKC